MEAGAVALPTRTVSGLCAGGLRPALLMANQAPPRARRIRADTALRPPATPRTRIVCLRPRQAEFAQASLPRPPAPPARQAVRPASVARGADPALAPLPPPTPSRAAAVRLSPAPQARPTKK
jgi:hypothetical protein